MIVPSKRLKEFIELYENKRVLGEKLDIDPTLLSREDRGTSSRMIEGVLRFTGWKFEEAFLMVEGE